MPTRRTLLGTVGAGVIGALAGCGRTDSTPSTVTLEIANTSDRQLRVFLRVFPFDTGSGLSEHTLFQRWFDFGPQGSDRSSTVVDQAFEAQKAVVQVGTDVGITGEYTFVPDCAAAGSYPSELRINVTGPYTVAFDQNVCQ